MTKLEIFNIALGEHGKHITETDITNGVFEAVMCETYYRAAVLNVLGECDWAYRVQRIPYDVEYDRPEDGWLHGFTLPYGLLRIVKQSDEPYQIMGNKYLTDNPRPRIYGIMDCFDEEMERDDMCYLVGYNLAFLLCQKLSPANNEIMSLILQNYQAMLKPMLTAQSNTETRTIEEGGAVSYGEQIPEYPAIPSYNRRHC